MSVFDDAHAPWTRRFGRASHKMRHALDSRALFDDAALEALLDCLPDERIEVFSTNVEAGHPDAWARVSATGLTGAQLLQAVRKGQLWIELPAINRRHHDYAALCAEIFAALEAHALVLGGFAHEARLVIGSPRIVAPCRVDLAMETLWQLRGAKTVHVYPPHAPFVAAERLERIVHGQETGRFTHDPHWDGRAEVFELRPGDMLSWRQGAPCRATNGPTLNVALATTHLTREARRQADLIYANALLRRGVGLTPAPSQGFGPVAIAKLALAKLIRATRVRKPPAAPAAVARLRLDPERPGELLPL